MKLLNLALMSLAVCALFSAACYGYDIVQVTNTPDVDENSYSIAVFGNTVYVVWRSGNDIYFDKSTDLGKTWGIYRKVIGFSQYAYIFPNKILVDKSGNIYICYIDAPYIHVLKSADGGQNFLDKGIIPDSYNLKGFDFAIDETGNVIYLCFIRDGTTKIFLCRSYNGGETFTNPQEIDIYKGYYPGNNEIKIETSKNGKDVYMFVVPGICFIDSDDTVWQWLLAFTKSSDYGVTFDELKGIHTGESYRVTFATDINSTIDKNGKIYLGWTFRGGDWSYIPDHIRLSESNDGGETFLEESVISDGYDWYHPGVCAGKPIVSSIAVDNEGNVYSAFYKYLERDNYALEGLYFDKRIGTEKFNIDQYLVGSIKYLSNKPMLTVTPDGKTAFIMWNNSETIDGSHDLFCVTFPINKPPVLNPIGNKEVNEGDLLEFTVSATDPDGDVLTYSTPSWSSLPYGATFDSQTGIFSWRPEYFMGNPSSPISYGIIFTVTDGLHIDEETITVTVNNTNRSPFFAASIGNKSVNEGSALPITLQATDPDGDAITYSMINAPAGAIINPQTGQFSWTPDYTQAGTYVVTFIASDGTLSAGDTITITVNNVPQPPQVIGINPSSGQGKYTVPVTFAAAYSDPDGSQDIKEAYLMIDTTSDGKSCFYGYYDQNANKLYIRNNANSSWGTGYAPGAAKTISNSYASLDCSKTTVLKQGNNLTINWSITFKSAFLGTKNLYLNVKDNSGAQTGWIQKGAWTITKNYAPIVGTITPSSGQGSANIAVSFIATYTDANGWQDIYYGLFLINTAVSGSRCFYGYYDQNANKLYLRNDANTAWLGGFAPGSGSVIENSYCRLDCSQTTVTGQGNTLSITWNITFKLAFKGAKNMYLYVKDDSNAANGWAKKGTWTIK